jgi:anti-anti-sigma factor
MPLLEVTSAPALTTVTVAAAHLSEWNSRAVGRGLRDAALRAGASTFRLDLGRVEYVSGEGLANVIRLHHAVKAVGGRLSVVNLAPYVHDVFAVTRLTALLDVHPR